MGKGSRRSKKMEGDQEMVAGSQKTWKKVGKGWQEVKKDGRRLGKGSRRSKKMEEG